MNYHYCDSSINKANNKIVSLRKIINGNISVTCYDSNDIVSLSLRTFSKKIVQFRLYMYQHINMKNIEQKESERRKYQQEKMI